MNKAFRLLFRQRQFQLRSLQSPTYYNLALHLQKMGWQSTRFNWLAMFSEKNFQFNLPTTECLEFKHLLSQLVDEYSLQVMPETFRINDHNWPVVLNEISDRFTLRLDQVVDEADSLYWILKPSKLNNGKHIKIFNRLSEVEQHYISSNRLGGEHVLQRYLKQPHLLKGHKYTIRMFVIVTNYAGAYLYPHGYLNVSKYPLQPANLSDLRAHLTNEHLTEDESNVIQIPTQRTEMYPALYPQMKRIVADVINALQKKHPQAFICKNHRTLAIFGFDFIVDANGRVWLLEANHGPCFPISDDHPLQKYLYEEFWQAFINSFVLPISMKQKPQEILPQLFESLG